MLVYMYCNIYRHWVPRTGTGTGTGAGPAVLYRDTGTGFADGRVL